MHRFLSRALRTQFPLPITLAVFALACQGLSPLLQAAPQRRQAGGAGQTLPQPARDEALRRSYVVQLAAFRVGERAETYADELGAKGYNARVSQGSEWNRVVIGPYAERTAAEVALSSLSHEGIEAIVRFAYAEDIVAVPSPSDAGPALSAPPAAAVRASVARWEAPTPSPRAEPQRARLQPQGEQPLESRWTTPHFDPVLPADLLTVESVKPPSEPPRSSPRDLIAANAPLSATEPGGPGVERRGAIRALGIAVLHASGRALLRASSENDVAVQVTDEAGSPVEGAVLTFSLPSDNLAAGTANGPSEMKTWTVPPSMKTLRSSMPS